MPTHKNHNKTQEIKAHLRRYKSIDRMTAATVYKVFDLPDYIRRLKSSHSGFEGLEIVKGSSPNTRYKINKHE